MVTRIICFAFLCVAAFAQPSEKPANFEFADTHVATVKTGGSMAFRFMRSNSWHGRWEIRNATMLDLVRTAYEYAPDKIIGGPSWLEQDRFDVIAKIPDGLIPDDRKTMLANLLKERWKLTVHKDSQPMETYALVAGKKPLMKEASGDGPAGCKPDTASADGAPRPNGRLFTATAAGPVIIDLGPGGTVHFTCRNVTMEAFAAELLHMPGIGGKLGTNPVINDTGLKGAWNFDFRFSMTMGMPVESGDRIPLFDAVEKQLGLKLESRQVPTQVLVVDSVNRQPSPNPPGTAEALPPIAMPKEFDVADIKETDPSFRGGSINSQPGGRLTMRGITLHTLLMRAFNVNNREGIAGLQGFADTERFDITAKAPLDEHGPSSLDPDSQAILMRNLLVDRFKLTYHEEQRQLPAYTLTAPKPKLKKADPNSRTNCQRQTVPPGGPGNSMLKCQNASMEFFASQLQGLTPDLPWPVTNSTNLEGSWDFSAIFSPFIPTGRGGRGDAEPNGAAPLAVEPSGMQTIFEALEKQLGLKLETQKRSLPVIVIDHIEPKPTEN